MRGRYPLVASTHAMTRYHPVLYLGSRIVSAVGNLLSVVVFTHLIGPADYGEYLLIFAWATMAYGFGAQWLRFAYFATYRGANAGEHIASYVRLLTVALCGGVALLGPATVLAGPRLAGAVFAMVVALAVYEAAVEISRTRLEAGIVSLCMVLRAAFVLAFGSATLVLAPSAAALAAAVAAGHMAAALPGILPLAGLRSARPRRAAMRGILRYGWPLILSFGILSLGQSLDRLLLAHYAGPAVLGPYGVIADLMRQAFVVVGEVIALALITVAKQLADDGRGAASDRVMRTAFNACAVTAILGAAFFVVFGEPIVRLLLDPRYEAPAHDLLPWFAVSFAFMTLRSFYFSQVIYFAKASLLDPAVAAIFVTTLGLLSLYLIPAEGAVGGAAASAAANAIACLASAALGRRYRALPVDWAGLGLVLGLAGLFLAGCHGAASVLEPPAALLAQIGLAAITAATVVLRFDLLRLPGPEAAPAAAPSGTREPGA